MELKGKIELNGIITLITGLHIGGNKVSKRIGEVDNSVIKTINNKPYIPGSSLKGKIRSLLAKKDNLDFISKKDKEKFIAFMKKENAKQHEIDKANRAKTDEEEQYMYDIFGAPGDDMKKENKTRLIIRDAHLIEKSSQNKTDITEIKTENSINRLTGTVNKTAGGMRQIERVPENTQFSLNMVFDDIQEVESKTMEYLKRIALALELLQLDYLGGSGSRGYGKVKVEIESVVYHKINNESQEIESFEDNNYSGIFEKLNTF